MTNVGELLINIWSLVSQMNLRELSQKPWLDWVGWEESDIVDLQRKREPDQTNETLDLGCTKLEVFSKLTV